MTATLATITTNAQPWLDKATVKYRIDTTWYLGKNNLRPGTPGYNPIYHTAEQTTLKALTDYIYSIHEWDSAHSVAGSGTVITVTANITPVSVFSATVTNPTTSPNIQIAMKPATAYTILGNNTGSSAVPTHFAPILASTLFANQGATSQVLHGNASGDPSWSQVSLTNDVTGTLGETQGGTGRNTYVTGDILYASATNTLAKRAIGSSGDVLTVSGGVPVWQAPTTGVTSITGGNDINVAGTTTPTITTTYSTGKSGGQTIVGGTGAGEQLTLKGSNTTNTGNTATPTIKFAGNTLNGSSTAQVYVQIQPTINASSTAGYTALQINAVETATGSGTKSLLDLSVGGVSVCRVSNTGTFTNATWNAVTIAEGYGGTNQTTYTAGDMLYASASNTLSKRAVGSSGDVLTVSGGVPTWAAPVVTASNTITFTNKRWTARVSSSTTVSATPSVNTDNYDVVKFTAQTANITSMTTNLTGTPNDGDIICFELTAGSGTPSITWGSSFVNSTVTAPTTLSTTTQTVLFRYSTTSSYGTNKWVCAKTF